MGKIRAVGLLAAGVAAVAVLAGCCECPPPPVVTPTSPVSTAPSVEPSVVEPSGPVSPSAVPPVDPTSPVSPPPVDCDEADDVCV